jgi:phosphinothricin acetyltransferase
VPAIAAIYDEAARTSAATFDIEGLPEGRWHETLAQVDPASGRLLLVALGRDGEVLGYAKSGEHKSRPAYATTCETSVYVARAARGGGVGGALYDELLTELDASPLRLAVGGVAEPNDASTRLHLSRGFTRVGTFRGVGVKRGREWDVTWYERPLAEPPLVRELRALVAGGGDRDDASLALGAHGRYALAAGDHGVPILDPLTGEQLAAIAAAAPVEPGERLLLEWCAEALAPLWQARQGS